MNVWYLSAHDQPRGKSARTYDFSRELVRRGHRVTMFTNSYCHWTHKELLGSGEAWRIEDVDGIRVIWLRTFHYTGNGWQRGVNMLTNARRAIQVAPLLGDRPDVVIGPSVPLGTGWAASWLARKMRAAFVFEVRDVWPAALADDGSMSPSSPVYLAFRAIEKGLYRSSDRISATMPFLRDHVRRSGGDPGKVVWIPNGVDFGRFEGFPAYDGGRESSIAAMYVGAFGAAHDVLSIVRAAAILQKKGNDGIRFIVVGDGVKKAECLREARDRGLHNIEFRAPVPKAEIPGTQMEADVLVAAVLDSPIYRFGINLNKLYDYFASGRPVVLAGKAPNDPVADSGCGYTVAPQNPEALADALEKLQAMAPDERKRLGRHGRAYVEEQFDIKVLGARMEQMLRDAIEEGMRHGYARRT